MKLWRLDINTEDILGNRRRAIVVAESSWEAIRQLHLYLGKDPDDFYPSSYKHVDTFWIGHAVDDHRAGGPGVLLYGDLNRKVIGS